jgi:magnesium-transporting ATPase (P-type)
MIMECLLDCMGYIYQVVRWGRAVYANIQKFIQFQLTVNIVALIINFVAACTSAEVPLTAVQVSEKSSSKSFSLNIMWCNSV